MTAFGGGLHRLALPGARVLKIGWEMGRKRIAFAGLAVICLAVIGWVWIGWGNSNALWDIVSRQCVPNELQQKKPEPCLKVDLERKYVSLKDTKGPVHDLIIPTYKLTGIEAPELSRGTAPPFFAFAWSERGSLRTALGGPIKDEYLSLAINSQYGRSQNQLHIHLACLRQDLSQAFEAEAANVGFEWTPLRQRIGGRAYLARRLSGNDLTKEDPFRLLGEYVASRQDKAAAYGLALFSLRDGSLVLLATRRDVFSLNFGSIGDIQDYSCALAGGAPVH
jgi:CDP-diacylglycerol pyrophosphatase